MTIDVSARLVLVVEYEARGDESAASILAEAGYRVAIARTFEEAKHFLASTDPELVVTEVRLGAHNGLQLLLRRFYSDPRRCSIAIDDRDDSVLRAEAERVGAAYTVRPLKAAEFVALANLRLECGPSEEIYAQHRRWMRHHIVEPVEVTVNGQPARLLDAGYGGFRMELRTPSDAVPEQFVIGRADWPMPLHGTVVWQRSMNDTQVCGAALEETQFEALLLWKRAVDAWRN